MKHLALTLAAIAIIGTCGCGRHKVAASGQAPSPASRAAIDLSSPDALATSMDRALRQKDYDGIVTCIQPDYRKAFRSMLDASTDYTRRMNQVSDLLDDRVDPAAGRRLRAEADDTFRELVPSPLAEAVKDGQVQWSRVTIVPETPDQVAIKVDGLHTAFGGRFFIVRSGQQWYARPLEDADTFNKDVKGLVKAYKESIKVLGKIEGKIKSGKITAENVNSELWPRG